MTNKLHIEAPAGDAILEEWQAAKSLSAIKPSSARPLAEALEAKAERRKPGIPLSPANELSPTVQRPSGSAVELNQQTARTIMLKRTLLQLATAATVVAAVPFATNAQEATMPASSNPTETGYAEHEGLNIYYEVHGDGEPIVLLHGAYMSARIMTPLAEAFAANRQVIVIEQQGHGRTNDTDRPFTFEAMSDDVAVVLDAIGVERVDVFGYSMGGGTALQFAIRHPERVRKLVAASAAISDRGFHQEMKDLLPQMSAEMFAGSPILTDYEELSPNPDRFPTLVEKLVALYQTPFDWPHSDLAGITAPTLLIFGDSDAVTPEHQVEMFRAMGGGVHGDMLPALPKVQLAVLPGTTHLGVMFSPELVHSIVETFLSTEAKPPMAQ